MAVDDIAICGDVRGSLGTSFSFLSVPLGLRYKENHSFSLRFTIVVEGILLSRFAGVFLR